MIKVAIKDKLKQAEFEVSGFTAEETSKLLAQLLFYMKSEAVKSVDSKQPLRVRDLNNRSISDGIVHKTNIHQDPKTDTVPSVPQKTVAQAETPRPRRVDLLNSERTLTTPLADLLGSNQKLENEPKKYTSTSERSICKTKFSCPSCNLKKDKQVPNGYRFTSCENCGTLVRIRPANQTWGAFDDEGYQYHADSIYTPRKVSAEGHPELVKGDK
ncbi:hypothetical protein BG31_15460 [Bacillus subtilis subsp. subtilis]|uniref:hypothetical protein n=1 Tax=Bacillus subtilis TaxID=1423 RepID=UPI000A3378BB|nr:hypothetical protein [Bacillus subtilis]OTQ85122.1 hypothetical protein BG31_15460 [Bacillus subtilis subsp. subtilis]